MAKTGVFDRRLHVVQSTNANGSEPQSRSALEREAPGSDARCAAVVRCAAARPINSAAFQPPLRYAASPKIENASALRAIRL